MVNDQESHPHFIPDSHLDLSRRGIHAHSASEDNGHGLNNRVPLVSNVEESSGLIAHKSMWMEREYASTASGAHSEM